MSYRAFITGIGGFAGSHLAEALLRADNHVEGTVRPGGSSSPTWRSGALVPLHPCDVRSSGGLVDAVRKAKPDVVYHLAATASVSEGEADPHGTIEVNLTGTLHLLEAIRREIPGALLVHISSCEVYGKVLPEENPIREGRPEAPVHAYGLSKLLQEELARSFAEQHGMSIAVLRPWDIVDADRMVTTDGHPVTELTWRSIDRRDVARALACALHVPDLAYECFHITATPGGEQATDTLRSERRLGWRAARRFAADR